MSVVAGSPPGACWDVRIRITLPLRHRPGTLRGDGSGAPVGAAGLDAAKLEPGVQPWLSMELLPPAPPLLASPAEPACCEAGVFCSSASHCSWMQRSAGLPGDAPLLPLLVLL